MRSFVRVVVVAAVGLAPAGLPSPAAAQASPAPPAIAPLSGPPGTVINVSGTCALFGGSFEVVFTGTGGSESVSVPAAVGFGYSVDIAVPLSTAPGPASVTTTCPTPPTGPATFTVTPAPLPSAPTGLAAAPGNGFVRATWDPAPEGEPRLWAYSVVAVKGGALAGWLTVPGDVHQVSVPVGAGPVDVFVFATNRYGVGASSAASTTTGPAFPAPGPAAAPAAMEAVPRHSGAVVTWDPPTDDGGAPVLAYAVVAVRQSNGQVAAWRNVTIDVRSASLENLALGTYRVSVAAITAQGFGPASTESITVVDQPTFFVPPGPPPEVSAAQSASGMRVGWLAAPDEGSPILGYSVVAVQGASVVAWQNVGPDTRSTVLAALAGPRPRTDVYVMAYGSGGYGTPRKVDVGG